MILSSVDDHGDPAGRVVLLRGFDERGFVFYTNFESDKGRQLLANKRAALTFYWPAVAQLPTRQVRVVGGVATVGDDEADAYFAGRARESQIGAWASAQSRPLPSREDLLARFHEIEARFDGQPVPRPPHWSGFRVIPDAIELWQEGAFRLHVRERFSRSGAVWQKTLLNP
jgi:pyridoxamine 5'-phosphate oxidase